MDAFEYVALDPGGRERKGILEGDTARQVRQQLRDSGLTPIRVEVTRREQKGERGFGLRRGISALDLALTTRQLATLLRSGLPLEQALRTVAEQSGKRRLARIFLAVRARVREGHSLASGLAEFPQTFPEIFTRTVATGEESGHLDLVLERLADYTEARQRMRQKTLLALFYPALLVIVSILIVAGLLTYVVPQVVRVFDNTTQQLPWLTTTLIAISDGARERGVVILIALGLAFLLLRVALRRPALRALFHRLLLHLPLAGRLIRAANTARFARTLSILAGASVPILEALRISAEVLSSLPMRASVKEAAIKVREGASLKAALEKTGYFPPMMLSLLASGESSGRLEEMLDRAAQAQEQEMESTTAALLGLFEPLLILVMGGLILLIVLAILLPIFDLNRLVG